MTLITDMCEGRTLGRSQESENDGLPGRLRHSPTVPVWHKTQPIVLLITAIRERRRLTMENKEKCDAST